MDDYLPNKPGNLFFTEIAINGYRGRNFSLKMHSEPRHTVFELDGNTGKTTTIELLRWCFKYPQSKANGKFNHMWVENAHLLDDIIKGKQQCNIIIQFYEQDNKGKNIITVFQEKQLENM